MSFTDILAAAKARLEPSYTLVDIDYRDELPPTILRDCIKKGDLSPLYEGGYYADALNDGVAFAAMEILNALHLSDVDQKAFHDSPEWDELIGDILSRAECPEKEVFLKTVIHGYLRLQSNYDLWCPLYQTRGLNTEDDALRGMMAALSLNPAKVRDTARQMGCPIAPGSRWRDIPGREGKEVVNYKDFIICLQETPCSGSWTFVGTFDMEALLDSECKTETLTIPKGTTCLVYNPFDGGGSYWTINTIRDVPLKDILKRQAPYMDTLYVVVDEKDACEMYTTGSVYGEYLSEDTLLR